MLIRSSSLFDLVTSDMPDGSTTHTQSKDYPNQDSEKEHMENVGSNEGGIGSGDGPFLVVYMVDSFTYGLQEAEIDDPNATRLAMIGLLQCFIGMLKAVPENLHNAIQLQVNIIEQLV
jgi:MID domain of medPIWI